MVPGLSSEKTLCFVEISVYTDMLDSIHKGTELNEENAKRCSVNANQLKICHALTSHVAFQ